MNTDLELQTEKHNKKMEKRFCKSLTNASILDAFPVEAKILVPRHKKRLKRELKPFFDHLRDIRHSHYDNFTRYFIESVIKEIYMPRKKVEHYANLKAMERMMCQTTRGVTDKDIERAKEVDIWSLHDFEKRRKNMACCPFHQDDTPSFYVRGKRWVCYGCGAKGDSIDFVQKMNHMTFYDAVRFLNGK